MHRLIPPPTIEVATDDAYRATRTGRGGLPWVMANMISTADGAIEIGGVSGPLGSAADKEVFGTLRTIPDVILVGSGTANAERYQPPSTSASTRLRRLAHGAWPVARLAVVSGRLNIDLDLPMFGSAGQRPLVITTASADRHRRAEVEQVADIIEAGEDTVDLHRAAAELAALDARVVLSEGGPTLNAQLVAADLLDELCLTVAPMLVGGGSARIASGAAGGVPRDFDLRTVLTEDHYLFLRYLRSDIG